MLGVLGKDLKFEFFIYLSIYLVFSLHLYFPILATEFGQISMEWKIIMEGTCFTYINFEKYKIYPS